MRRVPWCISVAVAFVAVAGASSARAADANPHNLGSCAACHRETPRFGVDTRMTVTFTTSADDPALCAPCHPAGAMLHPQQVEAGSGPAGGRRSPLLPPGAAAGHAGKVVCTTCHAIHAADGSFGLLRGFPGDAESQQFSSWAKFCSECHGANLRRRNPHAGGEAACAYCHPARPKPGEKGLALKRSRELCFFCHERIPDAHFKGSNPFVGPRDCAGCHDPHATVAASPRLLSAAFLEAIKSSVTVRPHHRSWFCTACHENTDDYTLRNEDINALCDRCHASGEIAANIHPLRAVPPQITTPQGWPLAGGALTCLTCHEQGHEDQEPRPNLLRGGPYQSKQQVCRNCHTGFDLQESTIHVDINEGKNCEYCHKTRPVPGKDKIATVTFIADPDLLCIRCHDETAEDSAVHHQDVLRREIDVEDLPAGFPLYKGRIICATCHNPHLQESRGMRLRDFLVGTDICTRCHSQ